MPLGGYYLEVQGADELKRALVGTARGIKDLSRAHRAIGKMVGDYARANAPEGHGSSHDGRGHAPAGFLKARTTGGGGAAGAYVQAVTEPFHYLMVQEFGGTSFWHKGAAGSLRTKAHRGNAAQAARAHTHGHAIYKKPRQPRGYFLWNAPWRIRSRIGNEYAMALSQIAVANGIEIEWMDRNLDFDPLPAPGR